MTDEHEISDIRITKLFNESAKKPTLDPTGDFNQAASLPPDDPPPSAPKKDLTLTPGGTLEQVVHTVYSDQGQVSPQLRGANHPRSLKSQAAREQLRQQQDEKPFVDLSKVTITKSNLETDQWLSGRVNEHPGYTFKATVFDIGSHRGIDDGRISKLEVRKYKDLVAHYSRGWDQTPKTNEQREVVQQIVKAFPDRDRQQTQNLDGQHQPEPIHRNTLQAHMAQNQLLRQQQAQELEEHWFCHNPGGKHQWHHVTGPDIQDAYVLNNNHGDPIVMISPANRTLPLDFAHPNAVLKNKDFDSGQWKDHGTSTLAEAIQWGEEQADQYHARERNQKYQNRMKQRESGRENQNDRDDRGR